MSMRRSAPTTGAPASVARLSALYTAWTVLFAFLAIVPACCAAFDGAAVGIHDGRDVFLDEPFAGLGLSPRYFLDGVSPIARRDSADCAAGYHSCKSSHSIYNNCFSLTLQAST